MDYTWDFEVVADNFPVLLRGVVVTLELWAVAFPLGMLLGLRDQPRPGLRQARG